MNTAAPQPLKPTADFDEIFRSEGLRVIRLPLQERLDGRVQCLVKRDAPFVRERLHVVTQLGPHTGRGGTSAVVDIA